MESGRARAGRRRHHAAAQVSANAQENRADPGAELRGDTLDTHHRRVACR